MHSRAKKTNKMPKMFLHSTKHHIEGCVYKAKIKKHKKIGNNQKCPCKSEKKYKKCCKKNVILNKKTKKVQLGRRVQWDEN